MAFQTSILRDGEWVTETVNLQAALKASTTPKSAARAHPEPPSCGILSRTIVESPVVHRILPVRLRSETHNDIAFVGVSYVKPPLPHFFAFRVRLPLRTARLC